MDEDYSFLPPLQAEIATVIGLYATMKLAAEWGGCEIYIPARAPNDHWLVQSIGREAADGLCAYFAAHIEGDGRRAHHGVKITLPLGQAGSREKARCRAIELLDKGASLKEAARGSGLHQRTIQNIRAKLRSERAGASTALARKSS
jgi:hypothetical protein